MMLRGRHGDREEDSMVLRGVTATKFYYPPYDYRCPSSPLLQARLSITEEMIVAWNFDEIAPEVFLEELHTACEVVLDELVNKPSKRLSFAELVDKANEAGLLVQREDWPDPAKLLIELKDLRKNVRHRAAKGAQPWLEKKWEYVAVLLETLAEEVERNAT
jgi:hypothetical protein